MEKKNEQEQEHLRHFLHTERATRKFLDVSRCSRAKQRQRHLQKSVLHLCFFCLFLLLTVLAVAVAVAA